ncbi:electron transfer flavoprotein subunit alpha/FixB family protein [Oxyplasma meridianum]|uniref:Electron transfer flavoprotein subunit alpha/FixB family protein n=1 Tax=Oxyplasma meridianum TaxID=3073602 RepID=A0AAX4NHG1_9ARCH
MKCLVFSDNSDLAGQMITYFRKSMDADLATTVKDPSALEAYGAKKIFHLKDAVFPGDIAKGLEKLVSSTDYDYIFVGSTAMGRGVAGILSQKLGRETMTEISEFRIDGGKAITKRFFYGGKTVLEEKSDATVLTVMPGITDPEKVEEKSQVEELLVSESKVKLIERKEKKAGTVDLEKAGIIVSIGRGIGSQDKIALIEPLVKAAHAELAGSRPICLDYHWLSEDRQVGLSGKKVKPKVYIALGISGQIQHIAGMRGSKTVVAINKDKSAPIFEECDYGIVGDIFQIVPKLTEALK